MKETRGTWLGPLLLEDLLSHQAGLKGWLPLYELSEPKKWLSWLIAHEAEARGVRPEYSDIGFLLLGEVLRTLYGSIAAAYEEEVKKPLKLGEVQFAPLPSGVVPVSTEYCAWRKRILCGEVFDENAAALGGLSSHAGLFATARGLASWARSWKEARQGKSKWLGREVAERFTQKRGAIASSSWALGWDTRSPQGSSAGSLFSISSFGHLGYPGCSVWIDPSQEGYALFLTNRVHPSRYDERIRKLRPLVHDEIVRWWKGG